MKKQLLILSIATVLFASCEKKPNVKPGTDEPDPQVTCNVEEIIEDIHTPTTWQEGKVYVIKNRSIAVNSVLTIEAGAIIKFKDARLDISEGAIHAVGSADKRITFTSYADDKACGDSNGDGTATKAEKGDWKGIVINSTTGNIFKYCDFLYAGQNSGGYNNAIKINTSGSPSFTFDYCVFAHTLFSPSASYESSTAFYGSTEMGDPSVSIFTNNAFFDNGKPLYLSVYYTVPTNNIFHNPEKPSEKNTHNAVYVGHASGHQGSTVTWGITEVPYVLDEYHQIHPASTVIIKEHVVVKFKRSTAGFSSGAPQCFDLAAAAILTSFKDDAHGGDTNGDGNATTPAAGDWDGVYNSYPPNGYMQGANILYAAH